MRGLGGLSAARDGLNVKMCLDICAGKSLVEERLQPWEGERSVALSCRGAGDIRGRDAQEPRH